MMDHAGPNPSQVLCDNMMNCNAIPAIFYSEDVDTDVRSTAVRNILDLIRIDGSRHTKGTAEKHRIMQYTRATL